MYVPSDFFVTSFKWVEVFPPHRSLTLERPCAFHVMHKDVDPVLENDAVIDPPDADYLFSAKVISESYFLVMGWYPISSLRLKTQNIAYRSRKILSFISLKCFFCVKVYCSHFSAHK